MHVYGLGDGMHCTDDMNYDFDTKKEYSVCARCMDGYRVPGLAATLPYSRQCQLIATDPTTHFIHILFPFLPKL